MASTASTSNPPLFLTPFGLPPWLTPLQRPIYLSFSFLLDFNLSPNRFNVNPPLFLVPFGLQPAFTLLQCPIRHSFFFSSTYIYESLSQKFNFTPLLPTIFPSSPHHKNSRRDKPCREHLKTYKLLSCILITCKVLLTSGDAHIFP